MSCMSAQEVGGGWVWSREGELEVTGGGTLNESAAHVHRRRTDRGPNGQQVEHTPSSAF